MENQDIIARELMTRGDFAFKEKSYCKELIKGKKDIIVLDIGANIGTFAVDIAHSHEKLGIEVVCFEPQKTIYNQLCANIFINRLENIQAYNYAVGNENKKIKIPVLDFHKSKNPGGFTIDDYTREKLFEEMKNGKTAENYYIDSKEQIIDLIRIDDLYFDKNIAFIKIDVEGQELECLLGAVETIKKNKYPPIIFENWDDKYVWYQEKSKKTVELLKSLEYEVKKIEGRNFLAVNHKYSDV